MVRAFFCQLACALILFGQAPEKPVGLPWAKSTAEADKVAKAENRPLLWVVMKDKEIACTRMMQGVYTDPEVQRRLAAFVLVPCSLYDHVPISVLRGTETIEGCPQFLGSRCPEHRECEVEMRTRFEHTGDIIAPQHIVTAPDGKLLQRKMYEMSKSELLDFLDKAQGIEKKAADAPKAPPPSIEGRLALLTTGTEEERVAVAREIVATGSKENWAALLQVLQGSTIKPEGMRLAVIRGLGRRDDSAFAPSVQALLEEKLTPVRNATVVTLEEMANPAAVTKLLALQTTERDPETKKDLLRALGPTGRGNADARKVLLKEVAGSSEVLRIASIMALGHHLAGDSEVREALKLRWKKDAGSDLARTAIAYAYYLSEDSSLGDDLDTFIASEKNGDMKTVLQAVKSHLTGEDMPETAGGGRGGRGGGGGGRGGGRGGGGGGRGNGAGGGAEMVMWRTFGTLFAKDKFERNIIKDFRARFADRGR